MLLRTRSTKRIKTSLSFICLFLTVISALYSPVRAQKFPHYGVYVVDEQGNSHELDFGDGQLPSQSQQVVTIADTTPEVFTYGVDLSNWSLLNSVTLRQGVYYLETQIDEETTQYLALQDMIDGYVCAISPEQEYHYCFKIDTSGNQNTSSTTDANDFGLEMIYQVAEKDIYEHPDGGKVIWSIDGTTLIIGSGRTISFINPLTGKATANSITLRTFGSIRNLAISPDGKIIAVETRDALLLWDMTSSQQSTLYEFPVAHILFSPDGKLLVATDTGNTIMVWDVRSTQQISKLWGHTNTIQALQFSDNTSFLASSSLDRTLMLWDLATMQQSGVLKINTSAAISSASPLDIAPDGKTILAMSIRSEIQVWDVLSQSQKASVSLPNKSDGYVIDQYQEIYSFTFTSDGNNVILGRVGSIEIWDKEFIKKRGGTLVRSAANQSTSVRSIQLNADGTLLLTTNSDEMMRVWRLTNVADVSDQTVNATTLSIEYFALGDSIASGHGLMSNGAPCHRSTSAYPFKVTALLSYVYSVTFTEENLLACSGATAIQPGQRNEIFQCPEEELRSITTDIDHPNKWLQNQVNSVIDQLSERPTLVSITIGMNDFKWLSPNFFCNILAPADIFESWVNRRNSRISEELRSQLVRLLTYPNVDIVVTTYFYPVNTNSRYFDALQEPCSIVLGVDECYRRVTQWIDSYNSTLTGLVTSINQPSRVRLTENMAMKFAGHEAPRPFCGSDQPDIVDTWVQYPNDPASNAPIPEQYQGLFGATFGDCIHPNDKGASQYAEAVFSAAVHLLNSP